MMRVLVGVQGGGLNGIDAYAEQVAQAAVLAGQEVTLLVSSAQVAKTVGARLDPRVRILDLGLPEPTRWTTLSNRLWHGLAMHRLESGVANLLAQKREKFPIVHLNHRGLARAFRPWAKSIVVAAWFYPHHPWQRVGETWRHTRGSLARRVVLATKSLSYYWGDAVGYREADVVVAPTALLADHLLAQGIVAKVCPPPVKVMDNGVPVSKSADVAEKRIVACAGDLMHPRKNMMEGLQALKWMAKPGRRLVVEMIGRNAEPLKKTARELPSEIEVNFPGPLPPLELHSRMRQADLLLFPSLFEEWGYVAVEALLLGTPVVAYPVYPFPAMLADGLGSIAQQKTARSLAEAMECVLAVPSQGVLQGEDLALRARSQYGAAAVGERLSGIWTEAGGRESP